jgi:L-asparagine oxygenase
MSAASSNQIQSAVGTEPIGLDERERSVLRTLACEVAAAATRAPGTLAELVTGAATSLPPRLRDLRGLVVEGPHRRSHWVVGGLPVDPDDLGPTPNSWRERRDGITPEECALLLVGQALGTVFAWSDQQNGAVVHDIVPSAGEENSLLSSSSTHEMSLHTEDAFFPERADFVLLLCLRNPPRAPTFIADVHDVALTEEFGRLVRSDRYFFRPDDSHSGDGPELNSNGFPVVRADVRRQEQARPLIRGIDPHLQIRFDSDYVDARDRASSDALAALNRALQQARMEIVLQPGELLIIDNNRCVHGRGGFQASLDGRDRWLKRLNISTSKREQANESNLPH